MRSRTRGRCRSSRPAVRFESASRLGCAPGGPAHSRRRRRCCDDVGLSHQLRGAQQALVPLGPARRSSLGMSPTEQVIVAHVGRYHRGAEPNKKKHVAYAQLDKRTRFAHQAALRILRVADGFDRGHVSAGGQLKVSVDGHARFASRRCRCPKAKSLRLEVWERRGRLPCLEKLIGVPSGDYRAGWKGWSSSSEEEHPEMVD